MLSLASGWLYFGRDREAEKVLQAARAVLFGFQPEPAERRNFFNLAPVYAQTAGSLPADAVKRCLEELYEKLPRLPDTWSTQKHYMLMHLALAEAVVLAIAGDDSAIGGDTRRWLDDDEYIVRRRIHRDFHAARGQE